nr:MAG TPA: intron associated endonuclease [Crassvirales sp.]
MDFFTYFCSMEERKYIVYIHKNKINGKVYVGITHYTNPEKRWRGGREYKRNVLFNKAIQKYGWDNFEHLILFKNLPQEAACKIEVLLIKRYRVKNSCYNIADGGQGASAMNDVIKDKISKAGIGKRVGDNNPMRHLSLEQREFHSNKMKKTWATTNILEKLREGIRKGKELGRYKGNHNKMSEHVKQALIQSNIKPVLCFNLNGEFVKEYKSISEANMEFGINKKSSAISRACKEERKTAYGFIWKFKEKEVMYGT